MSVHRRVLRAVRGTANPGPGCSWPVPRRCWSQAGSRCGSRSTTSDGLVAQDYYKQGMAVNKVLAKEENAARLGLSAVVELAGDRHRIAVTLAGADPREMSVRFVHATRSGHDLALRLARVGPGRSKPRCRASCRRDAGTSTSRHRAAIGDSPANGPAARLPLPWAGRSVRRAIWILWPSFLVGGAAETAFFALVDPMELHIFAEHAGSAGSRCIPAGSSYSGRSPRRRAPLPVSCSAPRERSI